MLVRRIVSWYFEPSQPQRIISVLSAIFNLSPSYSAHKSPNHFKRTGLSGSRLKGRRLNSNPLPPPSFSRSVRANTHGKGDAEFSSFTRFIQSKVRVMRLMVPTFEADIVVYFNVTSSMMSMTGMVMVRGSFATGSTSGSYQPGSQYNTIIIVS